jgi:hypothetical protein
MGSAPEQLPSHVALGLDDIAERYRERHRKKVRARERGKKTWESRRRKSGSTQGGEGWGRTPGKDATKLREAEDFLRRELADGPVPAVEVIHRGKLRGLSRDRLQSARARMAIVSERIPSTRRNSWRLPESG